MKRFTRVFLAALLVAAVAAPAPAWELSLTGRLLWGYDYIDQTGNSGFFGRYDTADPSLFVAGYPHFAAYDAWVGARTVNGTQYGLVSGADASLQWMRAEMEPEFRINNAIRLRGLYEIGALNPYTTAEFNGYGLYTTATHYGTYQGFAWGKWNQLWVTAQTPWGILVAGKRPAPFGPGAQYEGRNASSESLALVAPYGPFRIGVFLHPHREERWLVHGDAIISTTTSQTQQSAVTLVDGTVIGAAQGTTTRLIWDRNQIRNLQPGAFVTYSSGALDMGILYEWWTQHDGPNEAANYNPAGSGLAAGGNNNQNTYNGIAEDGSLYAKYNNGRFFFNAEVAWFRASSTQQPSLEALAVLAGGPTGTGALERYLAPKSLESWKYLVELGGFCGPGKLSLLFSYVPGPDRRQGLWIDKQSWENVAGGLFLGNSQVFLPYSLLMGYQYAAGVHARNNLGEGYMSDAISYGARLDYAVAANLNVSMSFFTANRQSKGWGWGSLTLGGPDAGGDAVTPQAVLLGGFGQPAATTGAAGFGPNNAAWVVGLPLVAPSIPDDSLGWEVTAGVDWKILEGVTINMRAAYWNVGSWFKYACIDKNFITTGTLGVFAPAGSTAATAGQYIVPTAFDGPWGWGINPSRNIDPIVMFQGVMTVDF